jgi:hypothetical protein
MVSLGSAPVGPILGTLKGDATLAIDRNERAFDLSPDGSGAGIDPQLLPIIMAGSQGEVVRTIPGALAAGIQDQSTILVALRGPGGYPVLGSAPTQSRGLVDPSAVLATLSPEDAVETPLRGMADLPPLPSLESRGRSGPESEELACPDFLTAACGLVLGVGLTTGPLYPDLVAMIRTCLPQPAVPAAPSPISRSTWKSLFRQFWNRLGLTRR